MSHVLAKYLNLCNELGNTVYEKLVEMKVPTDVDDGLTRLTPIVKEAWIQVQQEFGMCNNSYPQIAKSGIEYVYDIRIYAEELMMEKQGVGIDVIWGPEFEMSFAKITSQFYSDDTEVFTLQVISNMGKDIKFQVEGEENAQHVLFLLNAGCAKDVETMFDEYMDEQLGEDEEDE